MNLILTRTRFTKEGIFGKLTGDGLDLFTLEHAYPDGLSSIPKLPEGSYACQRGPHRLHTMTQDFETFEITGVPGHTNILFHAGNFNADSEGCVLLGMGSADAAIYSSKEAFKKFIQAQLGVDSFTLVVKNAQT